MNGHPDLTTGRIMELRSCAERGTEVVTPAAAAELFGKSEPTVRGAARDKRIDTVFTVRFSEKAVRLYWLRSCIAHWGEPDPAALKRMRSDGHLMWSEEQRCLWNVLHPERLVTLEAAAD